MSRVRDLLTRKDAAPLLVPRLRALGEAVSECVDRVDPDVLSAARRVVERADRRLAFSGNATVVALAGATGSGKSSLFNALSGTSLATVGVRRPTTSTAMACTWGAEPTEELLDWLGVPRRHTVSGPDAELDGLVLLDLPDHDSTEVAHRLEVDRLVELVDVLVWVLDPQKYADAAVHQRYLIPLAKHASAMLVVLNQADRLTNAQRESCLTDLRTLLAAEGLDSIEVLAVSATAGDGLGDLRSRLVSRVAGKQASARRLSADVEVAAAALSRASGTAGAARLDHSAVDQLTAELAIAAGVGVVTEAVGKAWRLRGGLATGWPVVAWIAKFKPDPLRRLHLDALGAGGGRKQIDPSSVGRTSLPAASGVERARVDGALRAVADVAGAGLNRGWSESIKRAARSNADLLPDRIDRAVARTDLDLDAHRGWWKAVRVLQWLLVGVVAVGLGWLGVSFVLAYLQMPPLPRVTWRDIPVPTLLVLGGVLCGLLLAAAARVGVEVGARRRTRRARQRLRASIASVTATLVIEPVTAEQDRYERARLALQRATSIR